MFLFSCDSNDEQVKSIYLDKDLKSKIDLYIEDSVDIFTEELEADGGFFMWKNYRDYLGLGDVGFKERIHKSWNKAFDNKTLELYIKAELAKKHNTPNFKIDKNLALIDNYFVTLLFPFLQIAIEELLILLVVILAVQYIIIPIVAKKTLPREYKAKSLFSNFLLGIASKVERQNRIDARVKKIRKVFNRIIIVGFTFFTLFYYDFNDSLNKTLKSSIKKDIIKEIYSNFNNQSK